MSAPQGGEMTPVFLPTATAKAVNQGDLVGAADDGTLYKASEQTWTTDLATTRTAFVSKFFGTSSQTKVAGADVIANTGPYAGTVRCSNSGLHNFSCKAGTYLSGVTPVGPAKDAGNNLLDQTVEVVPAAQAIGIVVSNYGTALNPGTVQVLVRSTRLPG